MNLLHIVKAGASWQPKIFAPSQSVELEGVNSPSIEILIGSLQKRRGGAKNF
jgi:hypothetical protein